MIRKVEKRDGTLVDFNSDKIRIAVLKAGSRVKVLVPESVFMEIEDDILSTPSNEPLTISYIQMVVESHLKDYDSELYKTYKDYREMRDIKRAEKSPIKVTLDGISKVDNPEILKENANMAGGTPSGQMMKIASETAKDYALKFIYSPEFAKAHTDGLIHIHDNDYTITKTTTCLHYDLKKLFEGGFKSEHTFIREPQRIETYAELAAIVFQTNQNEQHGGQSIPAFDFFMAPGVLKSFKSNFKETVSNFIEILNIPFIANDRIQEAVDKYVKSIEVGKDIIEILFNESDMMLSIESLNTISKIALDKTRKQTYQAMESFLYNMETMHSRGGNQVVFSSINYGTDISPEGRMVMDCLLEATDKGGGKGETFIFPIQIFKLKEGVSFDREVLKSYIKEGTLSKEDKKRVPNFDLFIKSCEVSSKRLFPNFINLDAPFNKHEKWEACDPDRYLYETATMGCRTRVFENINGEKTSVGRGNLSFTTMNLVRLAIESEGCEEEFLHKVSRTADLIARQLLERYNYQKTAKAIQFPFMMENHLWRTSEKLTNGFDEVGDVLDQGTLGIGFIGGYEAMVSLFGEGHDKNPKALECLHKAVQAIKHVCEEYKSKTHLNYSVLATPAEGLSGRFTKIDKRKFGVIKGVTDREYYTNSFHVAVYSPISAKDKVDIEAPFHAETLGGHISYIELDGEAKKNIYAFVKLVGYMHDKNMGYFSINHPIDRCRDCNYQGIVYDKCPICGSDNISRVRRITGYLVGDMDKWNAYKTAEERDRVKHQL